MTYDEIVATAIRDQAEANEAGARVFRAIKNGKLREAYQANGEQRARNEFVRLSLSHLLAEFSAMDRSV